MGQSENNKAGRYPAALGEPARKAEWHIQTKPVRPMLEAFKSPAGPVTNKCVFNNIDALVQDIRAPLWTRSPYVSSDIKTRLIDVFERSLPDTPPQDVVRRQTDNVVYLARTRVGDEFTLLPRHIKLLMQYYGLPDGNRQTILQIATEEKRDQKTIRQTLQKATHLLRVHGALGF